MTLGTPAREQLAIIRGGTEVPGVTFHGLFAADGARRPAFPREAWAPDVEVQSSTLHGKRWQVLLWDVAFPEWPAGDAWRASVRTTFEVLVASGARVAWIGREGFFVDPPALFEPVMSGGVLAAMTSDGDFVCPLDPDAPIAAIGDADLLRLRSVSAGLADAA